MKKVILLSILILGAFITGKYSGQYNGSDAKVWFNKYDECDADKIYWRKTHAGLLDFEQCVEDHVISYKDILRTICPKEDSPDCLVKVINSGVSYEEPIHCLNRYMQDR